MDFSQVEAEFGRLKAQYEAGDLSEADFKARLQDLMMQDEQGRWWMIGYETGQWYVHDGEKWVRAEPSRPVPEAPPVKAEPERPTARTTPPEKPVFAEAGQKERTPQAPPSQGPSSRPRLPIGAGIAAAVVVVAVIAWLATRPQPTPTPVPTAPAAATAPAKPTQPPSPTPTTAPDNSASLTPPPQPPSTEAASTTSPKPSPVQPANGIARLIAPSCDYGGELKAIEALDALTVKFTLCYPDVGFPAKVALPPFGIHPAEYLVATGGAGSLLEAPIGTGPYELEAWRKGSEIRLKANPDYWGQQAKIPQVQIHWNPDADARLGYLKTGNIQGMDNPAPQAYTEIQNDASLKLYLRQGLNTGYLGIDGTASPFDDVRVRQAVALAIDRESLVSRFYPVSAIIASHFTPCAIPYGCTGESWYSFDPARAQQLLAEAGYPDGFETTLFYRDAARDYLPDPAGTAQAIADMLGKSLSVRVTPRALESAEFLNAIGAGKLPFYLRGWVDDCPDPANALNPFYGEFSDERFRTQFPDLWEILDKAATTASPDARSELYTQANNLIKRYVPVVPLVHAGSAAAFRASVSVAHSSPLYLESFAAMSLKSGVTLVWKQAAEPESLYCADESEPDTLRACAQITESLLTFRMGTADVIPALAERYESSEDLTMWTFHLRPGVKFHDGSALDAGDVVTSWAALWDASSPLHRGRTGEFLYFNWFFERLLNASQ